VIGGPISEQTLSLYYPWLLGAASNVLSLYYPWPPVDKVI